METLSKTDDTETKVPDLRAALDAMPTPLFAVLDGGRFDDVEDELADVGIRSRSLFLEGGDEGMRRDGPWLVALTDRHARDHIERLALAKPCAVFWSCLEGEQVLWRHLRTINQILIPDERVVQHEVRSSGTPKFERVLFRHWDPAVLSRLSPLLNWQQFARMLGPASAIMTSATEDSGIKRAIRPPTLPTAQTGPLRLDEVQISSLKKHPTAAYRNIKRILMEKFPDMDRGRISDTVDYCESKGIEQNGNIAFLVASEANGAEFIKSRKLDPYLECSSSFSADHKINMLRSLMPKEV